MQSNKTVLIYIHKLQYMCWKIENNIHLMNLIQEKQFITSLKPIIKIFNF